MKKFVLVIFMSVLLLPLWAQQNGHSLSVDFGSYRNRYVYPITNLQYTSPVIEGLNLRGTARLRSYGTWFFYSKNSYDLTLLAEYYFGNSQQSLSFSAGLGLDARLRFINDVRSQATNSVEPLVSLSLHATYGKFSFNIPYWMRFYINGTSFAILPEISYHMGKRVSVFFRSEVSYLTIYRAATHEWRYDNFIGTHIQF